MDAPLDPSIPVQPDFVVPGPHLPPGPARQVLLHDDTLLEKVVLVLDLVAVLSLAPHHLPRDSLRHPAARRSDLRACQRCRRLHRCPRSQLHSWCPRVRRRYRSLYVWIPPTHTAAPIAAAAVLSGAAVKAGVIGPIRFLPFGTCCRCGEALAARLERARRQTVAGVLLVALSIALAATLLAGR